MKRLRSFISLCLTLFVLISCIPFANAASIEETLQTPTEKITHTLKEQYKLARGSEIPVMVWFSDIDLSVSETAALAAANISKSDLENYGTISSMQQSDEVQTYIETKRAAVAELYTEYNQRLTEKYFSGADVLYISRYSPVVLVNLDEYSTMAVAECPEIQMISYYGNVVESVCSVASTNNNENTISLNNANSITGVSAIQSSSNYGYKGKGVKIGVLEISLPNTAQFSQLKIYGTTDPDNCTDSVWHANSVLEIVSSIAPDAYYYLGANSNGAHTMQVIEDLISFGVNIISASRTIGGSICCKYAEIEKWLDHIAYQHDIHFVQAAGNNGGASTSGAAGPSSGAMAYNTIAVGNLYVNGTTSLTDDTIWTGYGPSSYYTGNTLAYKPDICAPGQGVVTRFGQFGGTSGATPHVAGVIALLCEQRAALKTQQNTIKAILTASVNFSSPHRYTPNMANYKKYGAGLLDCVGACYVAGNYRYVTSNFPSNTTSKTHTFNVTSSDTRIRVSLAFNIKSVVSGTDHDALETGSITNLNIQVKDPNGNVVGSSTTSNNSVEIVDFVPSKTGTYSIVITRADKSTETVYYGLAWR